MLNLEYELSNLCKSFVRNHYVLKDINLNVTNSDIFAITGPNGSGKSTLIKILAGVLLHDSGTLRILGNGIEYSFESSKSKISLVAPYLNLYEEFTPIEHYQVSANLQGIEFNREKLEEDLALFNIYNSRNTPIRNFSSGMKQRMKFILAMQSKPSILLLDEPTANLDSKGIDIIFNIVYTHHNNGGIVVIGTNEEREKAICNKFYDVTNSNSSI